MPHGAPHKIIDVVTYRGWGGYFFEDLEIIRQQGTAVADRYHTKTGHDRFPFVRTPAPVVGIGLKLEQGSVHWGDAVAVSFGGKSGRAGPGSSAQLETWFLEKLAPWIKGRTVTSWLETEQAFIKEFPDAPPFVRYAVSQAIISAVSSVRGEQPFKVMAKELKLPVVKTPVPLHGSSGADWHQAVDRMLARRLDFLPQGQFESILDQIGAKGEKLLPALKVAFEKAQALGAAKKAVIFTESRRTQQYLFELLTANGYEGRLAMLNGTNTDPGSRAIYQAWLERHEGEEIIAAFPLKNEQARLKIVSPHFIDKEGARLHA